MAPALPGTTLTCQERTASGGLLHQDLEQEDPPEMVIFTSQVEELPLGLVPTQPAPELEDMIIK